MEEVDEFLPDEYFEDVKSKISYNIIIAELYHEFSGINFDIRVSDYDYNPDYGDVGVVLDDGRIIYDNQYSDTPESLDDDILAYKLLRKGDRVSTCMSAWTSDYYRFQSIKDIKRVVLCKDKFCYNCQSMLAQKRYSKYMPVLDKLSKDFQLLHIVFTIPNMSGGLLLGSVNQMYKAFPHLIRFFKGGARVSGLDFDRFGYVGAIRSLEITGNSGDGKYHPHFHCIFAFTKDFDFTKGMNFNVYSWDKKKGVNVAFSDFNVLLQKLWFLTYNNMMVTKENVDLLPEGYDVLAMPADKYYHECFKYATKGIFKDSFNRLTPESLQIFQELQPVLDKRRIIQGYGCLKNVNDSDVELLEEDFTKWYTDKIAFMQSIERPQEVTESFEQIYDSHRSIKYMSKFSLKKDYLKQKELEGRDSSDD
jgi:plasmid rolling circle replication initiator protein Rep